MGKKNWKNGKRSILTKVRSEVKFKDNMQRDALFRGIPLFGTVMREEWFAPWGGTSHFVTYQLGSRVQHPYEVKGCEI